MNRVPNQLHASTYEKKLEADVSAWRISCNEADRTIKVLQAENKRLKELKPNWRGCDCGTFIYNLLALITNNMFGPSTPLLLGLKKPNYIDELGDEIRKLQAELKAKDEEIERLKGTCICMDCGKVIKVTEQSNHIKECPNEQALKGSK